MTVTVLTNVHCMSHMYGCVCVSLCLYADSTSVSNDSQSAADSFSELLVFHFLPTPLNTTTPCVLVVTSPAQSSWIYVWLAGACLLILKCPIISFALMSNVEIPYSNRPFELNTTRLSNILIVDVTMFSLIHYTRDSTFYAYVLVPHELNYRLSSVEILKFVINAKNQCKFPNFIV